MAVQVILSKGDGHRLWTAVILRFWALVNLLLQPFSFESVATSNLGQWTHANNIPPPPEPEPVQIVELPLPPVAPVDHQGACTADMNPAGTGCIGRTTSFQAGGFLPDSKHVAVQVYFTGAPAAPHPASIFEGTQLIIIKTDNTTFSNGDAWKCVTCGVPRPTDDAGYNDALDYPQAFNDGKRILAGRNIIECDAELSSDDCTSDRVRMVPIRWNGQADHEGLGLDMRELRLHPDNVHLGWSAFSFSPGGSIDQFCYFGRLTLNPHPDNGEPRVRRYDLEQVTALFDQDAAPPVEVHPEHDDRLVINPDAITVGELRGFSGDGREVTYIGYPVESSNIDVFAADLTTGAVRRLTSHPEYTDPVDISPDSAWTIVMDTRSSGRQMFLAGLRGVPPLTDLVSVGATSSTRNNGDRRFFQPWLLDRHGERGSYIGQQLNAAGDGKSGQGDVNDPEWNGRADPKWSPDGTQIVYWQALTVSPACGGKNPLPCYNSTASGSRTYRVMLARLTSRKPLRLPTVEPAPDLVPWGTPYVPGQSKFHRPDPPAGHFILKGRHSGWANVTIAAAEKSTRPETVRVVYHGFSDDGVNVLNGSESVTARYSGFTEVELEWFSDLEQQGPNNGTKKSSEDGFRLRIDLMTNIFHANGTLTTVVNARKYEQPADET